MRCIVTTESGATYVGETMGTGQHGLEDVGFTWQTIVAMVQAGDGADSNGEGLHIVHTTRTVCDVAQDVHYDVPIVDGLYVPQGRAWGITETCSRHCAACDLTVPWAPYCTNCGRELDMREGE